MASGSVEVNAYMIRQGLQEGWQRQGCCCQPRSRWWAFFFNPLVSRQHQCGGEDVKTSSKLTLATVFSLKQKRATYEENLKDPTFSPIFVSHDILMSETSPFSNCKAALSLLGGCLLGAAAAYVQLNHAALLPAYDLVAKACEKKSEAS